MSSRNFDEWLSKFRPSISSYDYYIDFDKVVRNVEEIKVELNILNSLIGSKNIEEDTVLMIWKMELWRKYFFRNNRKKVVEEGM